MVRIFRSAFIICAVVQWLDVARCFRCNYATQLNLKKHNYNSFEGKRKSTSLYDSGNIVKNNIIENYETIFAFKGLKSENFAHPLDSQVTKQLRQIPFLESIARRLYIIIEQAFVVDNLGSSILVGPEQMPILHKSLITASKILDIETPDLYIKQNQTPNAYTLAFMGRKPFIVIHTGLLDLLNEKEVMSVIGHELGHLKCEHGIWVTLLNILTETADATIGPILPIRTLLMRWQRSAEFSCDRAALLVSQDYKVVASVLMKLCGGSSKNIFVKELNIDAFLAQLKTLEVEKKTMGGRIATIASEQVSTHPIPLSRVNELMKWSQSAQYSGLIERSNKIEVKV
jgi:hypothetical protein